MTSGAKKKKGRFPKGEEAAAPAPRALSGSRFRALGVFWRFACSVNSGSESSRGKEKKK